MIEVVLYIFVSLITILIVLKLFRMKRQHAAASNVVFAKYTFEKLPKDIRQTIHEKAKSLVLASESKMQGFANEVERFGWYALAMDALNIDSKVPDNPVWRKVKNPYKAINPGNGMFFAICTVLKKNYGIEVDISKKTNYGNSQGNNAKKKK